MQNLGVVCAKAPRNKSTKLIKMNVDEFVALAEVLGRKPIMAKLSGVSSIIPQKADPVHRYGKNLKIV